MLFFVHPNIITQRRIDRQTDRGQADSNRQGSRQADIQIDMVGVCQRGAPFINPL